MKFQLTYAFDRDNVMTITLDSHTPDLLGAHEEAVAYIEKEHGANKSLELIAMSLLKLQGPPHAN